MTDYFMLRAFAHPELINELLKHVTVVSGSARPQARALRRRHMAGNIIPATVTAKFNIRFNTNHRSDDLIGWLEEHFERVGGPWHAAWRTSAQPFVTPFGTLTDLVLAAVETVTWQKPALSTGGGTSDARFITRICPVVEFGLVGKTMHQIDEHVHVADIDKLAKIYHEMLVQFFKDVS